MNYQIKGYNIQCTNPCFCYSMSMRLNERTFSINTIIYSMTLRLNFSYRKKNRAKKTTTKVWVQVVTLLVDVKNNS